MNGVTLGKSILARDEVVAERVSIRALDLWWGAVAATLIPVSLIWDFSWESSIGVDRFWSPPHLATYIGVWLCGLLGLRLIFAFTFARQPNRETLGVSVAGFRGPSGAWILLWGALVMQAALPFDKWWQQVYGLGAGLWHPPQILKAVSFITILFGGIALCAAAPSGGATQTRIARVLLIWQAGLLLTMCAVMLTATNYPNWQHGAWFYKISCAVYPGVLLVARRALPGRWSATQAALIYTLVACGMVWLLPLFPARPLTAPIHNPTDHLMPPTFPLLLVVPAVVMDWLCGRTLFLPKREAAARRPTPHPSKEGNKQPTPGPSQEGNKPSSAAPLLGGVDGGFLGAAASHLRLAAIFGVGFVAAFVAAQWFFAEFLLSPTADNWFFAGGGKHWPFYLKIDQARVMFWNATQDPLTTRAILLAAAFAVASSWVGILVASWLNRLRR